MKITAFYAFKALSKDACQKVRDELYTFGVENDMRGLVLIATEGVNGTVCGSADVIAQWKAMLEEHFGVLRWNDSEAEAHVFPRWFVKIRPEIVALKQDDVHPSGLRKHLSPSEWNAMMEEEDVTIIDARNTYETAVGMFEGAVDPNTQSFQEFPNFVKNCGLPKDKKILMYCTGGIRCEKALIAMENEGFTNVYQLKGGILGYLQECPEGHFQGECFVFDHRVAVDQNLKPSRRYSLCPHCGDPGDLSLRCLECDEPCVICSSCNKEEHQRTCSKLCKHKLIGIQKKKMAPVKI